MITAPHGAEGAASTPRSFRYHGPRVLSKRYTNPRFEYGDDGKALRHNDSAPTCRVAYAPTQPAVWYLYGHSHRLVSLIPTTHARVTTTRSREAGWVGALRARRTSWAVQFFTGILSPRFRKNCRTICTASHCGSTQRHTPPSTTVAFCVPHFTIRLFPEFVSDCVKHWTENSLAVSCLCGREFYTNALTSTNCLWDIINAARRNLFELAKKRPQTFRTANTLGSKLTAEVVANKKKRGLSFVGVVLSTGRICPKLCYLSIFRAHWLNG